jgi:hypothetical protein
MDSKKSHNFREACYLAGNFIDQSNQKYHELDNGKRISGHHIQEKWRSGADCF